MDKKQAIEYLQLRLVFLNNGHKVLWSLTDRAAVSALCINAVEQTVALDVATPSTQCGCLVYEGTGKLCGYCNRPPRQ